MTNELADVVVRLRALQAQFEQQRSEAPPGFRPALGIASHFVADWIDAIEDEDTEGRTDAMTLLRNAPTWLQHLPRLSEMLSLVTVAPDPRDGVVIEWHRVPPDLREATISVASMIVDAASGRYEPGGRPRNKSA